MDQRKTTGLLATSEISPGGAPTLYPSHAVVKLRNQDDVCALLRLLIDNGYTDVSFTSNFRPVAPSESTSPSVDAGSQTEFLTLPPPIPFLQPRRIPVESTSAPCFSTRSLLSSTPLPPANFHTIPPPPLSLATTCAPPSAPVSTPAPCEPIMADVALVRQRGSTGNAAAAATASPANTDDVTYVRCKLCNNPIMSNRSTNLINHVKRHATLKQYQCPHCSYQHNETAKVRLHMLHNHGDNEVPPIDRWTPQLQASWEDLLHQCFPDFVQSTSIGGGSNGREHALQAGVASSLVDQGGSGSSPTSEADDQAPAGSPAWPLVTARCTVADDGSNRLVPCMECGQLIDWKARVRHVHKMHLKYIPYSCSKCSFTSVDYASATKHVQQRECGLDEAEVVTRDLQQMVEQSVAQCFPEAAGPATPAPKNDPIKPEPATSPESELNDPGVPVAQSSPLDSEGAKADYDDNEGDLDSSMDGASPPAFSLSITSIPISPSGLTLASLRDSCSLGGVTMVTNGGRSAYGSDVDGGTYESHPHTPRGKRGRANLLECQLCQRKIVSYPRQSLLNHAKRHCYRKQFKCRICSYASSEAAHVRNHMSAKHGMVGNTPMDNKCPTLEAAWNHLLTKCFPTVRHKERKNKLLFEYLGPEDNIKMEDMAADLEAYLKQETTDDD